MYTLRKIPLLRILVPFCLGIGLAIYRLVPELAFHIIAVSATIVFLIFKRSKWKEAHSCRFVPGLLMFFVIAAIGGMLVGVYEPDEKLIQQLQTGESALISIEVAAPVQKKKKSIAVEAFIKASKLKGIFYFDSTLASRLMVLQVGDELIINTRLQSPDGPANPLQFDYKRYLQFQRIYFQSFVKSEDLIEIQTKHRFSITQCSADIRSWIVGKMENAGLTGDELGIAGALVIGEEKNLSQEIRSAYSASGAMHVISVSGLHIGIVYLILRFLLTPLLKNARQKQWTVPFMILLLWLYSFVTGLSPCVQRATLMFSFVALGNVFGRSSNIYNMLGASAFFLLMIEPYLLMDVGFQLSYLALLGIVLLQGPISKLLYIKNKWAYRLWEITAVAIAAQLTTGILSIYYFHQFPNYFLIANLAVIPLSFVMLVSGVAFVLLCWIPYLDFITGWCLKISTWLLNQSLIFLEDLPGSVTNGLFINAKECWFLYFVLISLIITFLLKNKHALFTSLIACCLYAGVLISDLFVPVDESLRVYSVPKSAAIGLFLTEPALLTDTLPKDLQFFIGNERVKRKLNTGIALKDPLESTQQMMVLPDQNVLLFGRTETVLLLFKPPNLKYYHDIRINYLLIESPLFNWRSIGLFGAEKVLLGNRISWHKSNKLKAFLNKSGIECTRLDDYGSFALK